MSRVILHIGTHKTGTSALQYLFFINRDILETNNILYPQAGWGGAHHGLAGNWVDVADEYRVAGGLEPWRKGFQQIAVRDVTVLLSSEEFSRAEPARVDMMALRELLKPFDQVQVLCTLRNQASYIQSIYMQTFKHRAPSDVDAFIEQALESHTCDGLFLDFNQLHQHLLQGFEPGELHYISYEGAQVLPGGLQQHYCDLIAPGLMSKLRVAHDDTMANISPSPLAAWLASRIARGEVPNETALSAANDRIERHYGQQRTSLFTRQQLNQCQQQFEQINRQFEDAIQGTQPEFRMAPVDLGNKTLFRDDVESRRLEDN